jgi:hypothetical protein
MFPWWWFAGYTLLIAAFVIEIEFLITDLRAHRSVAVAISSLFVLLYAVALVTAILWYWAHGTAANVPYWIKAGIGTCVTVSLLTGLHIADIITRRRK